MATNVGFIGLGKMGRPMTERLLVAGFEVTVFNRSRAPMEELAAKGAIRWLHAVCGLFAPTRNTIIPARIFRLRQHPWQSGHDSKQRCRKQLKITRQFKPAKNRVADKKLIAAIT